MSSFGITSPSFPSVPMAPGVPPVLRTAASLVGAASAVLTLLQGDAASVKQKAGAKPTWGIFTSANTLLAAADSIKTFDYKQEWRVPNYPMERGAFQSYNKVQTPSTSRITMTKSGTSGVLQDFLNAIDKAANSTDLFNINAGSIQYANVSIESYNYRRSASYGVTMLTVELVLLEIRLAPDSSFNNTAAPNGADPVNGGSVQAAAVTTAASTTNGAATNNAQFQSGNADAPSVSPEASSLPAGTAAALTSTETPVVSANQSPGVPAAGASFPASGASGGKLVDGNGNVLSYAQGTAPGVATYTDRGDGTLIQTVYNADGLPSFTKIPKPPAVQ